MMHAKKKFLQQEYAMRSEEMIGGGAMLAGAAGDGRIAMTGAVGWRDGGQR